MQTSYGPKRLAGYSRSTPRKPQTNQDGTRPRCRCLCAKSSPSFFPKRRCKSSNKMHDLAIIVCDKSNKVAASLIGNEQESHPPFSCLWDEKRVIFQSLFFQKELVLRPIAPLWHEPPLLHRAVYGHEVSPIYYACASSPCSD